jgi:hypothetical protein
VPVATALSFQANTGNSTAAKKTNSQSIKTKSAPAKKSFVQILDSEINSQVDSLWM